VTGGEPAPTASAAAACPPRAGARAERTHVAVPLPPLFLTAVLSKNIFFHFNINNILLLKVLKILLYFLTLQYNLL
jgi:hypothetical protein